MFLEIQKDAQNWKSCKWELNCSSQESRNDLFFLILEGERAEDVEEEKREEAKKEGEASKTF